jgi:hypothetical protein
LFEKLIKDSKGQRLWSGLAILIWQIGQRLAIRLGTKPADLLEYVLNQRDLWDDARLTVSEQEDDEDESEDRLEEQIANLDVALFSLIESLDADVSEIARALDAVLKDSLWKRTMAREEETTRQIELELLRSRAEWLWRNSSAEQRRACFYSGLGRKPGLFIYEQLDALVDQLVEFQSAVNAHDADAAAAAAVTFYESIMQEPFFAVRKLPAEWGTVLAEWVKGTAFSEILVGRALRDAQRAQVFIQDGVVFRLVWAAEAVRVQAISVTHSRAVELGDGPAHALTHGVSSVPAALLCQIGFPSRVGAMWVSRQLSAAFTDMDGLRDWMRQNNALLSDPEFWESDDLYRLWTQVSSPTNADYPRPWTHASYTVNVDWKHGKPPATNSQVRIIAGNDRSGTICETDLTPLGVAQFTFNPHGAALDGNVTEDGKVRILYFGS